MPESLLAWSLLSGTVQDPLPEMMSPTSNNNQGQTTIKTPPPKICLQVALMWIKVSVSSQVIWGWHLKRSITPSVFPPLLCCQDHSSSWEQGLRDLTVCVSPYSRECHWAFVSLGDSDFSRGVQQPRAHTTLVMDSVATAWRLSEAFHFQNSKEARKCLFLGMIFPTSFASF